MTTAGTFRGAEPRPGLRDVGVYVSPQLDVAARLNTNECPYPPPEVFGKDLARAVQELPLNRYPDGQARRLREALAEHAGHVVDGTWVANGSNEILIQLLMAYGGPGRTAMVFEPTYLLHSRIAWLTHTPVLPSELDEETWLLGEEQVAAARGALPDVVFVCSPNNPTGNSQPVSSTRALAEALPSSLVVVDEAYVEFGGESALPLVATHPNVAVVRTFSKAFALAGARVGYCLADPLVVEDLQRVRLPYHLSSITQAAGLTALHHSQEALPVLESVRAQRDRILQALRAMPGLTVYPSDANFILFTPPSGLAARDLWQALLDRGVMIRDLTAAVPDGLRVTVGAPHEVDLFLTRIQEVLT